jgi:spore maturation protein CgeB
VKPLYCSVDPMDYFPVWQSPKRYDLGYLGTYSPDRQPALTRLLLEPARLWPEGTFCVAGSQYPPSVVWPVNVARVQHLVPAAHRRFYNRQRLTLNITRADMMASGYSPSVRLFEAAACGVPIMTDEWPGLQTFFTPDREILVAHTAQEALACIRDVSAAELDDIATRGRMRVLSQHTAEHRACELEAYLWEAVADCAAHRSSARHDSRTQVARTVTVQI